VTFFFNGGEETPFPGEERFMVQSPRVATYDLQPSMSAPQVTAKLVETIASERFEFIVVNFANCDMVGHTGILPAAIAAVETVDNSIGELRRAAQAHGYTVLLTADHGNAEEMWDPTTNGPHTAHTTNLVPLAMIATEKSGRLRDGGRLADLAPTILQLLGLPQPAEMTGESLLAV
jgi:2,3-bisphosphoglycerate-independent phosphoglycerate mutase